MAAYRLYFLDAKGGIQARQDLPAENETEAKTIARILWQACADCYQGYELWQGTRRLAQASDGNASAPPLPIEGIAQPLQRRVLEVQETLLGSKWQAAQSTTLLAATETLRRRLDCATATLTHRDLMRYICATTGSKMMSLQLVEGNHLQLRGSRGFSRFFDEYFAVVEDGHSACGAAFKNARQIVVPAIDASPIYAGQQSLEVLRAQGAASCVSTPFFGSHGGIAGMFSILRDAIWRPADGELTRLQHIANDITVAMTDPLSAAARRVRAAG